MILRIMFDLLSVSGPPPRLRAPQALRSAVMGSTVVARRAGTNEARRATATRTKDIARKVGGSVALTSKRRRDMAPPAGALRRSPGRDRPRRASSNGEDHPDHLAGIRSEREPDAELLEPLPRRRRHAGDPGAGDRERERREEGKQDRGQPRRGERVLPHLLERAEAVDGLIRIDPWTASRTRRDMAIGSEASARGASPREPETARGSRRPGRRDDSRGSTAGRRRPRRRSRSMFCPCRARAAFRSGSPPPRSVFPSCG